MRRAAEFLSRPWVLVGVPAVLFLALAFACRHCTVDDAFISFRCARNFAHGNGLVFNPGERVEAFSNPLWVLILSLASLARIDLVAASKLIGVACGAVTLVLLARLCRRMLGLSRLATFVILCYAATNISVVYYAVSGMETALYMAALVLMVYLVGERREMLAGVACAVLALTRPEGILFCVPFALGCYLNRAAGRRILGALAIPVAAYAALMLFRVSYYGAALPCSYHAKIGGLPPAIVPVVSRWQAFKQYTWNVAAVNKPVLFLALVGAVAFLGRKTAPMIASIVVAVFFVWYSKGDWMSFWRFYAPVVPFLVVFVIGALELIRVALGRARQARLFLVILLVPPLLSFSRTVGSLEALARGEEFNPAMHSRVHVAIGRYLAGITSPENVIVANEIGAIGYYTNCTVVDMLGLTDRRVTDLLRRGNLDAYADYILDRKPTCVVLNNRQAPGDRELHPIHAAIYRKMMETGLYQKDREFQLNSYKKAILFVRVENPRNEGPFAESGGD